MAARRAGCAGGFGPSSGRRLEVSLDRVDNSRREQLLRDGYCLVPGVLDAGMLGRLRAATDLMLDAQTEEHKARTRSQGSMFRFPQTTDSVFAELVALPAALAVLARLGGTDVTFTDAYLISKPPHSPQLFWHYDWFAWEEPEMYAPPPPQVFCMYYLTDTCRENGCLRVIPGSHTRHNPLHDLIAEPHSATLGRADDLDRAEFGQRPDEIDVPVRAGELVIGDARLLHAAHPNGSDRRRTVLTLWYQPDYPSLPERVKAQMVAKTQPPAAAWSAEGKAMVSALHPVYDGPAPPHGRMLRPKQSPAITPPPLRTP